MLTDREKTIFWGGWYLANVTRSPQSRRGLAHLLAHVCGPIPDPIFSSAMKDFPDLEDTEKELERATQEIIAEVKASRKNTDHYIA